MDNLRLFRELPHQIGSITHLKIRKIEARCNSAAYKKTKREEKVNAEFKNQQSKIVSASPVGTTETLPNPKAGNHTNLREKEFLSILEVATLLGASRWTIQRMIKSNRLPVAKLGSRTIIKRASIDNLFN